MMTEINGTTTTKIHPRQLWIYDLVMIVVLLAGAYFRVVGINWGDNQYLHPDERFLIWVTSDISPVNSLSEYFNTAASTLNPNNVGHGFYVYGDLPIILTRYLVQWIYQVPGWTEITNVGRPLSALADLMTALLIYLVASRLYDRRVGVLASAFYAFAVLPIQLSHYFKEDTFANFFTFLSIYFAVRVVVEGWKGKWEAEQAAQTDGADGELPPGPEQPGTNPGFSAAAFIRRPYFWFSIAFGVALGCAAASKISAVPVAIVLPAAFGINLLSLSVEERERRTTDVFVYLVLAALTSIFVFRVLQPYAFSGPGFFGVKPNPEWVSNMTDLRNQTSGDVDFPPALQWARRPVWFSGENLVRWGLGLPLGILAWAGFLWAGWRMLKGDWQRHALLWGWTALYFTWQSLLFNPTMRYQLPVYPTLAIFAGWAVVALWDAKPFSFKRLNVLRLSASLLGGMILVATLAWAFAFTRIYTHPVTRVAATRWIYQNVPGPINIHIQTGSGMYNQPIPYPDATGIKDGEPFATNFTANADGTLNEVYLAHVTDQQASLGLTNLKLILSASPDGEQPLGEAVFSVQSMLDAARLGKSFSLTFDGPVSLVQEQVYFLFVQISEGNGPVNLCVPMSLEIQTSDQVLNQSLPQPDGCVLQSGAPLSLFFTSQATGSLNQISLGAVADRQADQGAKTLALSISHQGDDQPKSTAQVTASFNPGEDPRGNGVMLSLSQPIAVHKGDQYELSLDLESGDGSLTLYGSAPANESSWDDGLPLRMDGYDGFGGIYQGDLNFEMYWDDNPDKLARFKSILDQADYIFISSNRQWATTTRVPERYPLTTAYYRDLIGCPPEDSVIWCYDVAQEGTFHGDLGFELVKVFSSYPNLGPLQINDQFAEEAFTVYDHPKVFIFRKTAQYSSQKVSALLDAVDLTQVVHVTPRQAGSHPANLMLPSSQWAEQQAGGTWSQLFNPNALQNRFEILGVLLWYLSVALLGLIAYPMVRLALPGLSDHGYPVARTAGMLLLSYLVWLAGSFQIPFSRLTISIVLVLMVLLAGVLAYRNWDELRREWQQRRRYYLLIEGLFLAFFLFDLLIRWGNPDLWHPYMGGEKPMDFSYFNAVLKSTTFPPYDPWFAGGYLNYYYYGFVLVGVLVKWLGIVPSFAYNLILPTMFAMIAMGAFSVAWNLVSVISKDTGESSPDPDDCPANNPEEVWSNGPPSELELGRRANPSIGVSAERLADQYSLTAKPASGIRSGLSSRQIIAGLGGALGMAVLGNLGTVRMIFQGYEKIVAPGGVIDQAGFLTRWIWAAQGFLRVLAGTPLPYRVNDWYWIPSRAISAPAGEVEPITEFPFFTALYADPHAHLFALPIALLAVIFALSLIQGHGRWRGKGGVIAGFLFGGLAIGALRPTNTWDFPTYLALGCIATGYALWSSFRSGEKSASGASASPLFAAMPTPSKRLLVTAVGVLALIGLSFLLYQPYAKWYGLGYGKIDIWKGSHTALSDYLTHWGLFLFVIVFWMAWETRDWMARTPASSLRKLGPYKGIIQAALLLLVAAVAGLLWFKIAIAWFVLPLAVWAGVLILRPGQPDSKRFVLFLVGTGLFLTLMVEVIVLHGDIARMNTVFKFYLQVWTLFAVSAAAALGWLLAALPEWHPRWRSVFQVGLAILATSAALFTLLGGLAKVKDRMTSQAPHTLDGLTYMDYSTYDWKGVMDLSQDYNAIRWMQEHVYGSPVIAEANLGGDLYRWGDRFTIYTGLPDVVGWEWHEQQQRALVPSSWILDRVKEITDFYTTTDLQQAADFLRKYNVHYIVVGQLEQNIYPGPGLDKFPAANGVLWREVYHQGQTTIYEVMNPPQN